MGMFDKFPYRNTRDLNLNWIVKKIIYLEGVVGETVSDVAKFLSKKGGKMEGSIDMQGNRVFNLPTPAGDTDATTKKYVDDKAGNYLPLAGGTMTGDVDMSGNKITSVATPEADGDVATKKYVDDHGGGDYLPLSGGTMAGAVNMGGNKITSVATPEADADVATKKYVDDHSGGVKSITIPSSNVRPFTFIPINSLYGYAHFFMPFALTNSFTHNITADKFELFYYTSNSFQKTTISINRVEPRIVGNILMLYIGLSSSLPNPGNFHFPSLIVKKDFTVSI